MGSAFAAKGGLGVERGSPACERDTRRDFMFRAVSKPRGARYDDARASLTERGAVMLRFNQLVTYLLALLGMIILPFLLVNLEV